MARRGERGPRRRSRGEQARACEAKTRYDAGKVAAREAERFGMSYYACLRCGGWHLTRRAAWWERTG